VNRRFEVIYSDGQVEIYQEPWASYDDWLADWEMCKQGKCSFTSSERRPVYDDGSQVSEAVGSWVIVAINLL
jgi:hypothetical protein